MQSVRNGAGLVPVGNEARADAIQRRRIALGIFSAREMEDATTRVGRQVPYASVLKAERGESSPRIYDRIEAALDLLEEEMEPVSTGQRTGSVVEVTMRGLFGIEEVVFKAPVENVAEMEAMIDRLISRAREGERPDKV